MNEFVAILFRLINFGITIAAAIYLFNRYALSMITEAINERQKKIAALEIQVKKSQDERILHEQLAQRQKIQNEQIHKQLIIWNNQFNQKLSEREYEKNMLMQKLEAKVDIQNSFIQERFITQAIMPQALAQARELLEKKSASPEFGSSYLNNLITNLHKSAQ
jgi:hypothetical protein